MDREAQGMNTPVKSGPEALGASTPLISLSSMDPMPTLHPPALTPDLLFNQRHPTSFCKDLSSPQTPTTLQMLLREAQGPMYHDQDGQIQGGEWIFIYQPFTTTDLLIWKYHNSFTEKPQALIDLIQSIIQTHKPTWTDC
jgi:hypothetical protein